MIELKNVSKIYKSKKATNTTALKDISIQFPEKGMVFILGKSGSGKSTLLNVIGGLDKYDNGEVIINGKSTKEFKEKDFDAFRNTYMGFIFQEYNLLENYSIEQNIKLSLELQHKKATSEEIQQALKQVELEDISKRKTNELSGGQKQRVAIARALIKNPEIILADEPTGNLDSQTSEQIWGILKKLSEEKLVIVVSHDKESAEKYGDRIIKIQDGLIVSDEGNKIVTNTKQFKLESAKLPFFYSWKMGVGSLFHKKIRLIFTTILIIFSMFCFSGMLSGYISDSNKSCIELMEKRGATEVNITKYKNIISYLEMAKTDIMGNNTMEDYMENMENLDKYSPIDLEEKDIDEIKSNTGLDWLKEYKLDSYDENCSMVYSSSLKDESSFPMYYSIGSRISGFSFIDTSEAHIDNLIGRLPENENEIVISSFIVDSIIYRGIDSKDTLEEKAKIEKFQPKDYNELINSNKYINFCNKQYLKVVGIVDISSKLSEDIVNEFKTTSYYDIENQEISEEFYNKIHSFYNIIYKSALKIYVHPLFIQKQKDIKVNFTNKVSKIIKDNNQKEYVDKIAYIDKEMEIINLDGIKKIGNLSKDEIIISEEVLNLLTNYNYQDKLYDAGLSSETRVTVSSNGKETMDEYKDAGKYSSKEEFIKAFIKDNEIIGKKIKTNLVNGQLTTSNDEYEEYTIVGILPSEDEYEPVIYYDKVNVENLITSQVHLSSVVSNITNVDDMKKVLKYYPIDNSNMIASCEYSEAVLTAATISYFLQYIAKYGVIFFLVFASIILMNFINSSINFRKKEIGTLRALGCRSIDIIKMFIYESLVLMTIALAITFAIMPNAINMVNNYISNQLYVKVDVLYFGIKLALEITGIMFGIVTLANVIPVRKITKMKPIDAILNK